MVTLWNHGKSVITESKTYYSGFLVLKWKFRIKNSAKMKTLNAIFDSTFVIAIRRCVTHPSQKFVLVIANHLVYANKLDNQLCWK